MSIAIVMYHYFREADRDAAGGIIHTNSVSPATIREQMQAYRERVDRGEMVVVSFDQLAQYMERGCRPHRRILVLTADDAWHDSYLYLFPLAREFRLPVHLGLITSHTVSADEERDHEFVRHDEVQE